MKQRHSRIAALAAIVTCCVLPSNVAGQFQYRTIALTGQPAPGTPAGVTYLSLDTLPIVNDLGQGGFLATLAGSGVSGANDGALYTFGSGSVELIAREGDAAPGIPSGAVYAGLSVPTIADNGRLAYQATLAGGGVTSDNDDAVYVGGVGAPLPVAREGQTAHGQPAGVNYGLLSLPNLSDVGDLVFWTRLAGPGVTPFGDDEALFAGPYAAPQLVARRGSQAPGTPADVIYWEFGGLELNDLGQFAFDVDLAGPGISSANNDAIYAGAFAAPQLVAREGDPAPGLPAGILYADLPGPTINDLGHVSYSAGLSGPGVTNTNERALYAGTPGGQTVVAREGDQAPGVSAGVVYGGFASTILNDTGMIAFAGSFNGVGVGDDNSRFIYAGDYADPQLIVREDEQAAGLDSGIRYDDFFSPDLNDDGQLAFIAFLRGTGITDDNDQLLYLADPTLGHVIVAREGDLFDVGGGDLRTIADGGISFGIGRNDDTRTSLGNDGTLAFHLTFTDGTSGLFTAQIPEPASLSLLLLPATALLRRRR